MDKQRHWLAASLRWLGALWLVGWALYVSYGDGRLTNSTAGMGAALAGLLIPGLRRRDRVEVRSASRTA